MCIEYDSTKIFRVKNQNDPISNQLLIKVIPFINIYTEKVNAVLNRNIFYAVIGEDMFNLENLSNKIIYLLNKITNWKGWGR